MSDDLIAGIAMTVIGVSFAGLMIHQHRRQRRDRIADDATPISTAGPQIVTDGDRYIQEQLAPKLAAGERISHQAYGRNKAPAVDDGGYVGLFAAITETHVYFICTRVGAFQPLLENRGIEVIDRGRIYKATRHNNTIEIELYDRTTRTFFVDGTKKLSNQRVFLRDAARVLAPQGDT